MQLPKVPWTTRLGTVGERAIQSRLASFSNPSKYEMDTGLDFYCELVENDSPSVPFYVQAKGTEHFDNKWGSGIPKSTIAYWLEQQHPVFLIVYDGKTGTCYWMSVEDHRYSLIQKYFATDSKTIHLTLGRSNILEQGRGKNEAFVSKVNQDSSSVQLFRGKPEFIGARYVKRIPLAPRSGIEAQQIKENVRAALYSLFQHYKAIGNSKTAQTICEFLAAFDNEHYNHFVWLGEIYAIQGKIEEARKMYQDALRICEADTTWPRESLQQIVEVIRAKMRNLESGADHG